MMVVKEEIKEIKEKLRELEDRLERLENKAIKRKMKIVKKYKGLTGGLRFLLDKGFFDKWRTLKDVCEELEREGYNYPPKTVSARLLESVRDYKFLVRKKEKGIWKYAKRK
jgi:predicted nuclease with TOPRIM domain